MDIERELERVIKKHKGREVGTFETRVDLLAEDCLREIRELKEDQRRNNQKMKELAVAYGWLQTRNEENKATLAEIKKYCNEVIDGWKGDVLQNYKNILALIDRKDD